MTPNKIVPADFPTKPPLRLAFVGEAPGIDEVLHGKPFVGEAGRVFNQLLRTAGIDRDRCLVTNVFNQKADGNDVNPWIRDQEFHTPHLERLQKELADFTPNCVVPLGGTALWALTGDTRIQAFRGTVLTAKRLVPGMKLLPTLHPSFIQRQWNMFSIVVGDLIKAVREAERGPEVILPKRRIYLEPTVKDVEWFVDRCRSADLLSTDIETGWGTITSIGFGPSAEEAMCVPFLDLRKPGRSYWPTADQEFAVVKLIRGLLESPVPKLGQNFTYDAFWMLEKLGIRVRNYLHDTRLLHHALYAELPKDLQFLGAAYSQQGAWKFMGAGYGKGKRDDS